MYSKRKMCCLIATCSLLVCMFRAEIFAKGNEQQELPEIIRWEEGRGFDEQGEQIVGSWAYDTVNVEGKYVLFDDMGNVSAKTDQWKERETYAENLRIRNKQQPHLLYGRSIFLNLRELSTLRYRKKTERAGNMNCRRIICMNKMLR